LNELSNKISEYIVKLFDESYLKRYNEFIKSEPEYYIRLNPFFNAKETIDYLLAYGIELQNVTGVQNAYKIIKGLHVIGKTLDYTLGKYYIQSLSSMIPPIILNPTEKDIVLDLCAAPGSKSTQISEIMKNKGTLYANEISIKRLGSLVHNFEKINAVNVGFIQYKGELLSKVFENFFDKILVDAPCSALGIVQKKGEVSNWWNEKKMNKIAEIQLRLLISAIKMSKVGGEIVYSTCTLTAEENEIVINKVLEKYPVDILQIELPIESSPGFNFVFGNKLNSKLQMSRRILPWKVNSEGFFIAKLVKTGITEPTKKDKYKYKRIKILNAKSKEMSKYLTQLNEHFNISEDALYNYKYIISGKDIFFIHSDWQEHNLDIFNRIGIKFGRIDKNGIAHLTSQSAQLLEKKIKQNIVVLTKIDQLKTYFSGATIRGYKSSFGQKVVKYDNQMLGTAVQYTEGLKSQFPRSLRTGNIIFK
jgi:16S rRNA (cytosine1407-C5)-methyltransferase